MDKGIRPAARAKFAELNALRTAGEYGEGRIANTRFRKEVMGFLMEEYGVTLASAATHYNDAFKTVKAAAPASVEGLGRPEDKKGGRKPRVPAGAAEAPAEVPDAEAQVQTLFTVKKKSDGTVIATDLDLEAAKALVARAAAAKKAKLYWV